jgi:hypothetical protein
MDNRIEKLLQRPRKEGIQELSSYLHSKLDKQLEHVTMSLEEQGNYWCSLADELLNIAPTPYAKKNAWRAFAVAQELELDLPHCVQAGTKWLAAHEKHKPQPILKDLPPKWGVFTGPLDNITPTDMTLLVASTRLPDVDAIAHIEKWLSKLQQKTSLTRLPVYIMQYDSGPDNSALWEYVVQPYLECVGTEVKVTNMPYLPIALDVGTCNRLDKKLSTSAKVWLYLNITKFDSGVVNYRENVNRWLDEKTKMLPPETTEHLVAVLNLIYREETNEEALYVFFIILRISFINCIKSFSLKLVPRSLML